MLFFFNYYNYFMINLMTCLNGVRKTDDHEKFVEELLNYVNEKIKDDSHKNKILC